MPVHKRRSGDGAWVPIDRRVSVVGVALAVSVFAVAAAVPAVLAFLVIGYPLAWLRSALGWAAADALGWRTVSEDLLFPQRIVQAFAALLGGFTGVGLLNAWNEKYAKYATLHTTTEHWSWMRIARSVAEARRKELQMLESALSKKERKI